jgi:predicted phage terminase large subunit-like protein
MAKRNPLIGVPPNVLYDLRRARWKARTDLGWLCREILGYADVSDDDYQSLTVPKNLHKPLIDILQKFPVPTTEQFEQNDRLVNGEWQYTPIVPIMALEGKRRTLILDSRGHLKTTINSMAHTIQWILNYPEIAILMFMSSDTKAADVLGEIKQHFQYNDRFRRLFPEHCPQKSVGDWGTMQRFTTEARPAWVIRREPTVMTASVEKGAAGYHVDVIKFCDIVDENNIQGNGIENVRKKFDISINLLVGPRYWMDVEGTRYHFGDTYGKIIERQLDLEPEKRDYNIFVRGSYKRDVPEGEKFTPEELKRPFLLDSEGKRIPWWPERFPLEFLESQEKDDPWLFACQRLNSPNLNVEGATPFPIDASFPKKIRRTDFEQNVRVAYKEICVDLAETDNPRSNYTCITVGTVAQDGRLYVEEIVHGKFLADKAVSLIFSTAMKHYRHLKCIKVEKSSYYRGLQPSLLRVLDTQYRPKGINFTFEELQRGNRTSKADRIHKMIQPWYKKGDLIFLDDIDPKAWTHLLKEMEQFPASATDDILDTISDFLMDKEYFGREAPRGNPYLIRRDGFGHTIDSPGLGRLFKQVQNEVMDRWLRIDDPSDPNYLAPTGKGDTQSFFVNPGFGALPK